MNNLLWNKRLSSNYNYPPSMPLCLKLRPMQPMNQSKTGMVKCGWGIGNVGSSHAIIKIKVWYVGYGHLGSSGRRRKKG